MSPDSIYYIMSTYPEHIIEIYTTSINDWQPVYCSFGGSKKTIPNITNNKFWAILVESGYLFGKYDDKKTIQNINQVLSQTIMPINNTRKIIWIYLSELEQLVKNKKNTLERIIRDSAHEKYASQSLKNEQKYQNRIDSDYQIEDYIKSVYFDVYIPVLEEYSMIRGLCQWYCAGISPDMIRIVYVCGG